MYDCIDIFLSCNRTCCGQYYQFVGVSCRCLPYALRSHRTSDRLVRCTRSQTRRSNINTFGWVRAEVVGANINTVFLLALCLTIIFDTIKRYISPEPIENPTLLLIVGSIGLGINIIGLFLFQGYHGHSHSEGTNGHSHEEQTHGHSHEEQTHGQNHDGETHGPSHDIVDQSKSAQSTNITIGINEASKDADESNHRSQIYTNEIEPIEVRVGSSEFKRHSQRALDEVIVDCTTQAHNISQSEHDSSAACVDIVDAPTTNKTKSKKGSSMNMHGVFLHVLADALGSVVVIISALIIKFVPRDPNNPRHWTLYVDPTLSIIIVIIITVSAIPLLKETTYVLLQTVPKNIEVTSIKTQLLEQIPEIDGIHELHVWRLNSNAIIATAHLHRRSLADYMAVANKVRNFFHGIDIHSTTIQYEQQDSEYQAHLIHNTNGNSETNLNSSDCLLSCPEEACSTKACCTKDLIRTNGMLNISNNRSAQITPTSSSAIRLEIPDEHSRMPSNGGARHMAISNSGFVA